MTTFSDDLMRGARNCVVGCGGARRGTKVLILSLVGDRGNPVDEQAVHALATACQEVGASPQMLWASGMEKGWWDTPSPIVMGAFGEAELVVNNTISIGRPLKAIRELMFGKKITMIRNMATTVDVLASEWATFPFELSDEITYQVGRRIDGARRWRVTHPNGTDVQGSVAPSPTRGTGHKVYGEHRRDGRNRPFPQGDFNPMSVDDTEGVIVFDRTLPWEARHIGVPELRFSEPLRVTCERNRMVDFAGGPEAQAYRHFYERLVPHLGDDAWNVSGWHAGIHPKAKMQMADETNPDFKHRGTHNHTSVLHFHLGGSLAKEYDYPFMWHLSNEIDRATVWLDGTKLYDEGHLTVLDDPEVRSFASRFGDPDALLAEVDPG